MMDDQAMIDAYFDKRGSSINPEHIAGLRRVAAEVLAVNDTVVRLANKRAAQVEERDEYIAKLWAVLDGDSAYREFPRADLPNPEKKVSDADLVIRGFDALWSLAIEQHFDTGVFSKSWDELTFEEKYARVEYSAAHELVKKLATLRASNPNAEA